MLPRRLAKAETIVAHKAVNAQRKLAADAQETAAAALRTPRDMESQATRQDLPMRVTPGMMADALSDDTLHVMKLQGEYSPSIPSPHDVTPPTGAFEVPADT